MELGSQLVEKLAAELTRLSEREAELGLALRRVSAAKRGGARYARTRAAGVELRVRWPSDALLCDTSLELAAALDGQRRTLRDVCDAAYGATYAELLVAVELRAALRGCATEAERTQAAEAAADAMRGAVGRAAPPLPPLLRTFRRVLAMAARADGAGGQGVHTLALALLRGGASAWAAAVAPLGPLELLGGQPVRELVRAACPGGSDGRSPDGQRRKRTGGLAGAGGGTLGAEADAELAAALLTLPWAAAAAHLAAAAAEVVRSCSAGSGGGSSANDTGTGDGSGSSHPAQPPVLLALAAAASEGLAPAGAPRAPPPHLHPPSPPNLLLVR
ncbi:hypothetical protein T492DRAFT_1147325 [Pavlovales sp. CCMP2436]|nr:hypothetical protein T492DRAFT_1147325 [Pavlovales sp. CCMP2436]